MCVSVELGKKQRSLVQKGGSRAPAHLDRGHSVRPRAFADGFASAKLLYQSLHISGDLSKVLYLFPSLISTHRIEKSLRGTSRAV